MNKLNIACGIDIRKGYVNLDYIKTEGVDIVHDLEKLPYPFDDNTFDEVIAGDIIEHLVKPEIFMEELWRICKPNAKIIIDTCHFSSIDTYNDLSHRRGYCCNSFGCYDIDLVKRWNMQSLEPTKNIRFKVNAELFFGTFYRMLGFNWLFNKKLIREFYESNLAYIFTARKVHFDLKVIKGENKE